jgi:hypothetical protein
VKQQKSDERILENYQAQEYGKWSQQSQNKGQDHIHLITL